MMLSLHPVVLVLVCMLLIISIVYVYVATTTRINANGALVVELQNKIENFERKEACGCKKDKENETYISPNTMWNHAAAFTDRPNELLPKKLQNEYKSDSPQLYPGRNPSRGSQPMNSIATTDQQMEVKDANSITGYRFSSSFPGPLNYGVTGRTIQNGEEITNGGVKFDTKAINRKPIVDHVGLQDDGTDESTFSPYGRVHAFTASKLTPGKM